MTDPENPPPNREVELKLALDAAQIDLFKRLMRARRVQPTVQNLLTRYFDTPDFALGDLGIALRLRRVGRRWLQTLKTEGARGGGLSTRGEYECPVQQAALDFSRFPDEALAPIPPHLLHELRPVFETRFSRTTWPIRNRQGALIEVALDVGEVIAGKRAQPLCEVELELKSGRPDVLFALALSLSARVSLLPLDSSKAERGIRLARDHATAPVRASASALQRAMTVEGGFAAICNDCLTQFQANLPGLLADDDPEYLHQARVALRRLRAALRLFQRVCPLPPDMQVNLRGWVDAMGPARDWDVLCLETLPAIAPHFNDPPTWAHFAAAAEAQRHQARQTMRQAIEKSNPGRQLLHFQRWLQQKAWRSPARQAIDAAEQHIHREQRMAQLQPLPDFAAQALKKSRCKVRKMAQDFAQLEPAARHRLRILIKRQRYAAEFFKPLRPADKGKPYLKALVLVQDGLGCANDAHVATALLETLSGHLQVAAFVAGWLGHAALQAPEAAFERALKKLT